MVYLLPKFELELMHDIDIDNKWSNIPASFKNCMTSLKGLLVQINNRILHQAL